MCNRLLIFFLLTSFCTQAQLRVYTVAGKDGATILGDGGPATAAEVNSTEGIWMDNNCNIYFAQASRVRKVLSGDKSIITIAGNGNGGYSGDGGLATDAKISPYGVFVDKDNNLYFPDQTYRIRKVDTHTGIISTFAGGGSDNTDNIPATNAKMWDPRNVYGDKAGNIYIGERARLRKITPSGIITTIAGTGTMGLTGDGGPATSAQIVNPHTMLFDQAGNLFFADRGNNRIRKINPSGIITTYAGSTDGYSGDGGPATAAQLSGPISFVIDYLGNMIIGDNQNNCMRRVDAKTGIITHFAGVGPAKLGSSSEGALATDAEIHPEFMYLDRQGNIYYSCWCNKIRKITGYLLAMPGTGNDCGEMAVPELPEEPPLSIWPNPVHDELHVDYAPANTTYRLYNMLGSTMQQGTLRKGGNTISLQDFPNGIYYLTTITTNGQRTALRVLKQ